MESMEHNSLQLLFADAVGTALPPFGSSTDVIEILLCTGRNGLANHRLPAVAAIQKAGKQACGFFIAGRTTVASQHFLNCRKVRVGHQRLMGAFNLYPFTFVFVLNFPDLVVWRTAFTLYQNADIGLACENPANSHI